MGQDANSRAEKMQQRDTLTPLDARNSLLLDRPKTESLSGSDSLSISKIGFAAETKEIPRPSSPERYSQAGSNPMFAARPQSGNSFRPLTPNTPLPGPNASRENLVLGVAPIGGGDMRQPTLPNVGGYNAQAQGTRGYTNPGLRPGYGQGGGYGGGYGGGGGYGYRGYGGY